MDNWAALQADTIRQYGRYSATLALKGFITRRCFRPVVTMRLCQAARDAGSLGRILLPICKVFHRMATHVAAIDFPWSTEIGRGLSLTHAWGMVVSRGARIGSNVTLFHGVTLGRRDHIDAEGRRHITFPTLEDDVWVGPHATIIGGITIGRGSRIAGGAFVSEDVPPYSLVAGNPSSVVKSNCIPDVMYPAP